MSATLIVAIIIGLVAVVSGGFLIVNLSGPLSSLKDMFIALIDLICNNAILFLICLLLFVIAFSVIKKVKFTPVDLSSKKQQKIDNEYRQQKFEADERQRQIDNDYREKLSKTKLGGEYNAKR